MEKKGWWQARVKNAELSHASHDVDCAAVAEGTYAVRLRAKRGACERVLLTHTFNKYRLDLGFLRADMPLVLRDGEYDYFALTVSGEPSRFAYIFELTDAKGAVWYYTEEGVSRAFDPKTAFFSHFQYPSTYACDRHIAPDWVKSAFVYQIFPERFCNGAGDKPYITAAWGDKPTPTSFFGGDLPGIRQKLPYLRDLGVTCLYLTPIFPSISNHKYDVIDYYGVDEQFGGKEAFSALMRDVKVAGMRVLLDGVFNHCSDRNPLFQDVVARGAQSRYHDWFFIDGDRPTVEPRNYQTFSDVAYMPRLNTGNPEVIRYFCDVAAHWVREYGISGWRLDVCDELSDDFLRELRKAVKQADPEAVVIGEVWHESAHWLRGDMLDGVMNYGLTKACLDYLAFRTITAEAFRDRLCRLVWRHSDAASAMMLNLMGSHDTERFLTRARGDVARLEMAYAVACFVPGMPCVYYGDEIGMTGEGDPDCRKGFPWDDYDASARPRPAFQALATLKREPEFATAAFSIDVQNGVPCLYRRGKTKDYCLLLNPSRREKTARCLGEEYTLAPDSYRMIEANHERTDEP